jgi:hypothetical protein
MTRLSLSENMRRIRHEERRSPVDAALLGIVALSDSQRIELARRYDAIWQGRAGEHRMMFTDLHAETEG